MTIINRSSYSSFHLVTTPLIPRPCQAFLLAASFEIISHQLQSHLQLCLFPLSAAAQISQDFYRAGKSFKSRISRKNAIPVWTEIPRAKTFFTVARNQARSHSLDYGQDNVCSKEACRCLLSGWITNILRTERGEKTLAGKCCIRRWRHQLPYSIDNNSFHLCQH